MRRRGRSSSNFAGLRLAVEWADFPDKAGTVAVTQSKSMIVYYCGTFVEKSGVSFLPDDRGLLFADGAYEVARSYGGRLLHWDEHMARLSYGLQQLRISGADVPALGAIARRLLRENSMAKAEATVYLQITRGVAPRTHQFPPTGTPPTVYLEARPFNLNAAAVRDGVPVIIVPDQRWARCDLKTICLLPNVLAHQMAKDAGAAEALFSRDGVLLEGSHSSMLFVQDGRLIAPPLSNYILGGITRKLTLELAAAEKIPVAIQSFFESDLPKFEEMMMVGTTSEIMPVITVNGRPVGDGKPGPLTRRLQKAFRRLVAQ